ncbi:MAG: hypothetical protein AAF196_02585 [Planctomycetota bacterium]
MTRLGPLAVPIALIGLAVTGLAAPVISQDSLRKSVRSVLDRAQQRIESRSDIWADHSQWESAWEIETDDLVIRTTRSFAFANSVAVGQQQMIGWFRSILGEGAGLQSKLVVNIWPDRTRYNAAGEEFGADHSSYYGSFLAARPEGLSVEAAWDPVAEFDGAGNELFCQMQITHSLLHGYVAQAFPSASLPTWTIEGLAEYFANYWSKNWAMARLQLVRNENRQVDVGDLLVTSEADFNDSQANARMITLGMLFVWLMEHREDSKLQPLVKDQPAEGPFLSFLLAGLRGQDMDTHPFRRTLGDVEALLEEFNAWSLPEDSADGR